MHAISVAAHGEEAAPACRVQAQPRSHCQRPLGIAEKSRNGWKIHFTGRPSPSTHRTSGTSFRAALHAESAAMSPATTRILFSALSARRQFGAIV